MSKDIQLAFDIADDLEPSLVSSLPSETQILEWLGAALDAIAYTQPIEINIRVLNALESQSLNNTYRNKDKATNVLSFESDLPEFVPSHFIGDLAICASVVNTEAQQQHKPLLNHWAHMCVHGLLHLLGYDHIVLSEAQEMETIEIAVLAQIGIDNPYIVE